MRAGDALGDLLEERLLDLDELSGLDHVEDLLDLTEEHHLKFQLTFFETKQKGNTFKINSRISYLTKHALKL